MSLFAISVLLIEDDPQVRTLWASELTKAGLVVDAAESCAEAIALVRRKPFDVLVVDYRLSDGTGVDVLRFTRQHGCKTPAILVSGVATREDTLEAGGLGAIRFVEKVQGTPKVLVSMVRAVAATAETVLSPFARALDQVRALDPTATCAVSQCRSTLYWLMSDTRVDLAAFAKLAELVPHVTSPSAQFEPSLIASRLEWLCAFPVLADSEVRRVLDCIAVSRQTDSLRLAEACGLSRSRLLALLRTGDGQDIRDWIRIARVRRAFRFVSSGDNLDYVAELAGFANGDQLSRDFRAVLGVTVTEIRDGQAA